MSGFRTLQEWPLEGPGGSSLTVKPGDKICFINPKVLSGVQAENTGFMIRTHGNGPFVLSEIRIYGSAIVLFHLVDKNEEETELSPGYFTKYEE